MKNKIAAAIRELKDITIVGYPADGCMVCCAKVSIMRKETINSGYNPVDLATYYTFGQMVCFLIKDKDADYLTNAQQIIGKAMDNVGAICEPVATVKDALDIISDLGKYIDCSREKPASGIIIS